MGFKVNIQMRSNETLNPPFQDWCVGQITLPGNFQQILTSTAPSSPCPSEGLQVICLGLSRTGTSSLKAALSIILDGKTFHAMDYLSLINNEVIISRMFLLK